MIRNKLIYIVLIAGCLLLGRSIGNTAENDSEVGVNTFKSSISGICFNDANGNNKKDPGETGIAAVTVTYKAFPYRSSTGTAETNAEGKYEFRNLRSGIYIVEAKTPAGFKRTGPAFKVVFTFFGNGTANFGFKATPVTTTTTTEAVTTTTSTVESTTTTTSGGITTTTTSSSIPATTTTTAVVSTTTTTSCKPTSTTTTSAGVTTTTTSIPTTTTTEQTTLIKLISFTATPGNKCVKLSWETESEIDNVGFNIYKAESEFGKYEKVNFELIEAKGSVTSGAVYDFTDAGLQNRRTYFYKLEDIDVHGESTVYEPVSATPLFMYGIK
jgi:hypothetical protein